MDPKEIAVAAMALLGPYLVKAGEAFAGKAGQVLAEKTAALYEAVKKHFAADDYAARTLARAEEQPDVETRRQALAALLVEMMERDPAFGETVDRLVKDAQAAEAGQAEAAPAVVNNAKAKDGGIAIAGTVNNGTFMTGGTYGGSASQQRRTKKKG